MNEILSQSLLVIIVNTEKSSPKIVIYVIKDKWRDKFELIPFIL